MFKSIPNLLGVALSTPALGGGMLAVLSRNARVFSQSAGLHLMVYLVEPIILWVAFGYFLGQWIPTISGVDYFTYLLPTVVALTSVQVAISEAISGIRRKQSSPDIYRQWSYTALKDSEIVLGEIAWYGGKAWISATFVALVAWMAGFTDFGGFLSLSCVAFLGGVSFSALGFFLSSRYADRPSKVALIQTLVILPMILFSNTFFPLEMVAPDWTWTISILPLAHLMNMLRAIQTGIYEHEFLAAAGYLILMTIIFTNLSLYQWRIRYRLR